MAGLVHQYQLTDNDLALSMARDMADYFVDRIDGVIAAKGPAHWQVTRPASDPRTSRHVKL